MQVRGDDPWLLVTAGVGAVILLATLAEAFLHAIGRWQAVPGFAVGAASSALAAAVVLAGAVWLRRSALSPARYRRVAAWCLGGGLAFLGFNLVLMLAVPPSGTEHALSWARWAFSLGTLVGFLVGAFEARAIDRAITAERLRVRQEETQRKNDLLEEFAGMVAHDLRNPLGTAMGRVELAREEVDSEHLDRAEDALSRMESIVEETLVLARAGSAVGEPEPVDLAAVVEASWATVETGQATLEVDPLPVVSGDPDRLRHVFENLFRNAVEHGDADVSVHVGPLPDGAGFIVEDDGPGIPAAEREAVFDPGHSTGGSSGFGLDIVGRIADAHGWDVRVAESPDGGARFEFRGVEVREPAARPAAA
ncbi:MAG: sensor histidine kinase [Halobacteriaceae archaeon]